MLEKSRDLAATQLYDRIRGAMVAGAIGDAMGGPVEGWDYDRIVETYGVVDDLLPYDQPPDYHNHFATAAGTVTDDTRLRHLVAEAVVHRGSSLRRGDLAWTVVNAYHNAEERMERGFLEEYALGGVYGESKLIWGGQMTNGFLMANAPIGLVCACDPPAAFNLSYDVDYISDGYAKYAAAMGAAAVAAAMTTGATPISVVKSTLEAAHSHRVEGSLTRDWQWYEHVFKLNERLIGTAVEIALSQRDVFAVREAYYRRLSVGPLGSEAAQSLAVALGMLVAADGDLRQTIIGCVNYGRDNDSYASVAGAVAGAMHGMSAVPESWWRTVDAANPRLDIEKLTLGLTRVVVEEHAKRRRVATAVDALI